jgi:hypothetical protein
MVLLFPQQIENNKRDQYPVRIISPGPVFFDKPYESGKINACEKAYVYQHFQQMALW